MKRIGIAASRIAKDNLLLYNFYVILISCLLSLLIFFISGLILIVGIGLISYFAHWVLTPEPGTWFAPFLITCFAVLAGIVGIITLIAIFTNIKFRK